MNMTCGVPQGSVLGPTLWNIYYDDVIRLEMPDDTFLVAYADDLALIVCGKDREQIEENITWAMGRIKNWMWKSGMQLAAHKTEVTILEGKRSLKQIIVKTDEVELKSQVSLTYLGILLGHNMNMGLHIRRVAERADKMAAALIRLMPNVGGPKAGRRKILNSVVNSIILYAAPAWKEWMTKNKYRKILETTQRKMAIRIASAYRTVSTKAIQTIAGTIPIHLLVMERTYEKGANKRLQKERTRELTMAKWQEEWQRETETAQWTKKLIPEILPWISRKHGEVGYYLTQFISGHGRFKSHLLRFKLVDQDNCHYCQARDTPEHTILQCDRWNEIRSRTTREIGEELTVENMIKHMLDNENKWNSIETTITEILQTKEREEKEERNT